MGTLYFEQFLFKAAEENGAAFVWGVGVKRLTLLFLLPSFVYFIPLMDKINSYLQDHRIHSLKRYTSGIEKRDMVA